MKFDIPVSSIMSMDLTTVKPEQKLLDVKHIFEKKKFHHHIPVVKEGNELVGMISLADFIKAVQGASLDDSEKVYHETKVKDIMSENVISQSPHTPIREAAAEFCKNRVHALPVTKDKKLLGMVTTYDILKLIS